MNEETKQEQLNADDVASVELALNDLDQAVGAVAAIGIDQPLQGGIKPGLNTLDGFMDPADPLNLKKPKD